jgi:hypothetical protein
MRHGHCRRNIIFDPFHYELQSAMGAGNSLAAIPDGNRHRTIATGTKDDDFGCIIFVNNPKGFRNR